MTSSISKKLLSLKNSSGTHSPSINSIRTHIPELEIKVDACFLSNPYATELFMEQFEKLSSDKKNLREVLEYYPSQFSVIAKNIGSFLNINPAQIFVANGAIEAIQAVLQNFIKRKIIINIPTFSSYYEFVPQEVDIIYNQLRKEDDFKLDLQKLSALIRKENADSVVIINPNNPDGNYLFEKDLRTFIEENSQLTSIILDISFVHFAYEENMSIIPNYEQLVEQYPNLVIIKSMSKDFGIAGIRAGYAIMQEERVSFLRKAGYLWNLNGITEYFFELYRNELFQNEYKQRRVKYLMEHLDFVRELSKINGLKIYPNKANFVLAEILTEVNSIDFTFNLLEKHGVYLRSCHDKIGLNDKFIRIASRGKKENNIILKALRETMA